MKREKVYVNLNTKFTQAFIDLEIKFQDQETSSRLKRGLNEVLSLSENITEESK